MIFWQDALQSIAQAGELTGKEVYLQFILMFLFPAGIFLVAGLIGESNGRAKKWVKYLGLLPLLVATWWALPYYQYATSDFIINAGQIGGGAGIAYKVIFIAPILLFLVCLVGCIIVDKKRKEMQQMM